MHFGSTRVIFCANMSSEEGIYEDDKLEDAEQRLQYKFDAAFKEQRDLESVLGSCRSPSRS
jgi:hypothetical protein